MWAFLDKDSYLLVGWLSWEGLLGIVWRFRWQAINAQLSARVMQNYNEFVTGMQMAGSPAVAVTIGNGLHSRVGARVEASKLL